MTEMDAIDSTNVELVHVLESQMQSGGSFFERKMVPVNLLQINIWLVRNGNFSLLFQRNSDPSDNGNIDQKSNLHTTIQRRLQLLSIHNPVENSKDVSKSVYHKLSR